MLGPGWDANATRRQKPIHLVTINVHGLKPYGNKPHLAAHAGSYCFATEPGINVSDTYSGRIIPFWPLLGTFPTVAYRFSPQERRAEVPSAQIDILPGSGLTEDILDNHSGQAVTIRIDKWTHGVTLDNAICLLAGRVDSPQESPFRNGRVRFTAVDGDPRNAREYPPGLITRESFPDAPLHVLDQDTITSILGRAPERIICKPISLDRRTWLYCSPPATVHPNRIEKGGVVLRYGYRTVDLVTPNGIGYTAVVFDNPVDQYTEGIDDTVSASGGTGLTSRNALAYLMDYAGLQWSSESKAELSRLDRDFPLSILVDQQTDSVLDLIRDRLIPQTPFTFTFRNGKGHLIRCGADVPEVPVGIGSNLITRLGEQGQDTSLESVFNAVEVRCGRDQYASTAGPVALWRAYRDQHHGAPDVRSLCAKSERLYGRRFLAFDANDLAVNLTENGVPVSCPGGEYMADLLIRQHALPRRSHRYLASMHLGLSLELNWRVSLTDANENLSQKLCRVSEIMHGPVGMELSFVEENQA